MVSLTFMVLSIIILNYRTAAKTLTCLSSFYIQYGKEFEKNEMEFIILDNNSQDGSDILIEEAIKKEKYSSVYLVRNSENAGFGRGCNLGASKAKGDYLLFLNSDTEVNDRDIISMIEFFGSDGKIGIIGPQLHNLDGSHQLSASKFYFPFQLFLMMLGLQRLGFVSVVSQKPVVVDWVSGGAMMVKRVAFEKLHGFDPAIFMYMEDMELCFRAKEKGFLTYFFPQATVMHASHGSSNRSFAIVNIYKGILYFYKKHQSKSSYLFAFILLKSKALILVIIGSIIGNNYLRRTYAQAFTIS